MTCNGTSNGELIRVYQDDGVNFDVLWIKFDAGVPWNYDVSGVTRVDVFASGGNDDVEVERSGALSLGDMPVGVPPRIFGGDGIDQIDAGDHADWIEGEGSGDELFGHGGADTMFGGGENDVMNGGAGNDLMYGGDGDDDMTGGAGDDTMSGQAGCDTFWADDTPDTSDTVLGGGGTGDDTVMSNDSIDVLQDI